MAGRRMRQSRESDRRASGRSRLSNSFYWMFAMGIPVVFAAEMLAPTPDGRNPADAPARAAAVIASPDPEPVELAAAPAAPVAVEEPVAPVQATAEPDAEPDPLKLPEPETEVVYSAPVSPETTTVTASTVPEEGILSVSQPSVDGGPNAVEMASLDRPSASARTGLATQATADRPNNALAPGVGRSAPVARLLNILVSGGPGGTVPRGTLSRVAASGDAPVFDATVGGIDLSLITGAPVEAPVPPRRPDGIQIAGIADISDGVPGGDTILDPEDAFAPTDQPLIVLHHRLEQNPAMVAAVSRYLRSSMDVDVKLIPVDVAVDEASTRYFFDGDQETAEDVAELLERVGIEADIRDFTGFEPAPSPGLVEIWLN